MTMIRFTAPALGLLLTTALVGCTDVKFGDLDLDLRDKLGSTADTSAAARNVVQPRPEPDNRGVISYPNYQVAVARSNDTPATIAARLGLSADSLARFNGMQPEDTLRDGEILALPSRVAEPSLETGALQSGPLQPGQVDVTTLASNAIENAAPTPVVEETTVVVASTPTTGSEPVRHTVQRGETAYIISRLYNVSPRSLAEWNGLDSDFTIRERQILLIPPRSDGAPSVKHTPATETAITTSPGTGTTTPTPPSAVTALPKEDLPSVAETKAKEGIKDNPQALPDKPVADIGQSAQKPNGTMLMPVNGRIIRDYVPGKSDGIDIAANAGAQVKAASSGQVAAVTTNSENVLIVVVKHPGDLLSVYTHLDDLSIKKGDAVSKGQTIGKVREGSPAFLHFEIRKGFESVDPLNYVN